MSYTYWVYDEACVMATATTLSPVRVRRNEPCQSIHFLMSEITVNHCPLLNDLPDVKGPFHEPHGVVGRLLAAFRSAAILIP
jgi:hypothetical protein